MSFVLTTAAFSLALGKNVPAAPVKPIAPYKPIVKPTVNPDSKPEKPVVTIIENTHKLLENGGYKFG